MVHPSVFYIFHFLKLEQPAEPENSQSVAFPRLGGCVPERTLRVVRCPKHRGGSHFHLPIHPTRCARGQCQHGQ